MPGCSVSSRDFLGLAVRRAGHEVGVAVDGGAVTPLGSVNGSERADVLVQRVAEVPGVRDVAVMLRVSERRAA